MQKTLLPKVYLSRLVAMLVGVATLTLVVACQTIGSTTPRALEFDARDYAFTAPDTLQAGLTTIRLVNLGTEPHHGQLLRLNDGVTFDEFTATLQQEGEGALRLVSAEGGPGTIDPQGTSEVTVDLKPGTYALACFISGPDDVPHLMKGMLKPIQVTESSSAAAEPQVRDTFTMKDFSFDMPSTLPAGRATYRVVNAGTQTHEFNILRLSPGQTVEDLSAWESAPAGPPPFESVGGSNAYSRNGSGYMALDLQPGTYVAICRVPDPASGVAHEHLGMIKEFTVQG